MKSLLYLAHRIPYPPNKGDKIRSYNLLARLAANWTVHLGAFIDDSDDWQHIPKLNEFCAETKFVPLRPAAATVRAMRGLMTGKPLTLPYYSDQRMHAWVKSLVEEMSIDCVVTFSSSMAQYVEPHLHLGFRSVVDLCDVDSDKWHQYSDRFVGAKKWIYQREARLLQQEEASIARNNDALVLVSDAEVSMFCEKTGAMQEKVHTVSNGIDLDYFDSSLECASPYASSDKVLVFVGAMDYWPNIDAVGWFAENIWPQLCESVPGLKLYVVGSNPGKSVVNLGQIPGICVTGTVEDVRPYLRHSDLVIAPLRVARGVQNKVLEAMAMEKPIVATAAALEGIPHGSLSAVSICDTQDRWIEAVATRFGQLTGEAEKQALRKFVSEAFSWDSSARTLSDIADTGRRSSGGM